MELRVGRWLPIKPIHGAAISRLHSGTRNMLREKWRAFWNDEVLETFKSNSLDHMWRIPPAVGVADGLEHMGQFFHRPGW